MYMLWLHNLYGLHAPQSLLHERTVRCCLTSYRHPRSVVCLSEEPFGVHEVIEETLVRFLYTTVDQAAPTCLMPWTGRNMVFIESTHRNKPNVTFSRKARCVVLIAPGVVVVSTDKLAFERKPFEWASQSLSADLLVSTSSILSFPSVMSPRMGRMSSCPWALCGSLRRRLWRQMKHCFNSSLHRVQSGNGIQGGDPLRQVSSSWRCQQQLKMSSQASSEL